MKSFEQDCSKLNEDPLDDSDMYENTELNLIVEEEDDEDNDQNEEELEKLKPVIELDITAV